MRSHPGQRKKYALFFKSVSRVRLTKDLLGKFVINLILQTHPRKLDSAKAVRYNPRRGEQVRG